MERFCLCWKRFIESNAFVTIVLLLCLALYFNIGWLVGWVFYYPESVPPWVSFLLNPFEIKLFSISVYAGWDQFMFVLFGTLGLVIEWVVYLLFLLFGGIAKLLLLP